MTVASNLERVRSAVAEAARQCGRDPAEIRILAVSKTFPTEAVRAAHESGQLLFGENRIQEAEPKITALHELDLEWHLVGHLQSNKVRRAVELFDVIQSIDSEKIVRRAGHYARELDKVVGVYLQINVGEEPQKSGARMSEAARLAALIDSETHLRLMGLMAIPPLADDPEESRPYFRRMRELLDRLNHSRPEPLQELSMGMSDDFAVAVQEGATLVRIGTAIFGERPHP